MNRTSRDAFYEVIGTLKNERVYVYDVFTPSGRYVNRNGYKWIDAIASDEAIRIADKLNAAVATLKQ